jgi:hypothetical protein
MKIMIPLAVWLCLAGAIPGHAEDPPPARVTIPFVGADPQSVLSALPRLEVSVNGGSFVRTVMDTGSTGLVLDADSFPLPPNARSLGLGTRPYSSSGNVENGNFYLAQVTVGTGAATLTATVPVLRVTSITCLPHPRDCTPTKHPHGVALMGVGFGQSSATQPDWGPGLNPLLNAWSVGGHTVAQPPTGYLLTRTGVTIGFTPAEVADFRTVKLTWNSLYKDWDRPPITVTGAGWSGTGQVLTDTGLAYMFVRPPVGAHVPATGSTPVCRFAPCARDGDSFHFIIGNDPAHPAADYTVTIGPQGKPDAGLASPPWVTVLKPNADDGVYVNTSFHFLNAFDYFYDFAAGMTGYRAHVDK